MDESENINSTMTQTYSRYPDFGPLNIKDWNKFLIEAREFFNEYWNKPFVHEETLDQFNQVKLIGTGSFGNVILIEHKQKSGEFFAMKAIEKEKLVRYKQVDNVKNEKLFLQSINFPMSVYLKYFFKDNSYIYMVLPFIPGGELFGYLKKVGNLEEDEARFYTSQVILALEYLHTFNFVYRDLKPENILMDHTGYLKLTDYGFCKHLAKDRTYTLCGTPEYLAPEVILNKGYGKSVDWWAVGVLMYDLVAGAPPFCSYEPIGIYEKIIAARYKIPPFFSSELKNLVKNILQIDISKRYGNMKNGVQDIKCHKWFKKINWMRILNKTVPAPYEPKYISPGDTQNFEIMHWNPPKIEEEDRFAEEFADF